MNVFATTCTRLPIVYLRARATNVPWPRQSCPFACLHPWVRDRATSRAYLMKVLPRELANISSKPWLDLKGESSHWQVAKSRDANKNQYETRANEPCWSMLEQCWTRWRWDTFLQCRWMDQRSMPLWNAFHQCCAFKGSTCWTIHTSLGANNE